VISETAESAPVIQREDGSFLIDGGVSIEDLRDLLRESRWRGDFEHETGTDYHTLAGLAVARFGRFPKVGEFFDWHGWRFEVVDLDGPRVDKLLVRRMAEEPSNEPEAEES